MNVVEAHRILGTDPALDPAIAAAGDRVYDPRFPTCMRALMREDGVAEADAERMLEALQTIIAAMRTH